MDEVSTAPFKGKKIQWSNTAHSKDSYMIKIPIKEKNILFSFLEVFIHCCYYSKYLLSSAGSSIPAGFHFLPEAIVKLHEF